MIIRNFVPHSKFQLIYTDRIHHSQNQISGLLTNSISISNFFFHSAFSLGWSLEFFEVVGLRTYTKNYLGKGKRRVSELTFSSRIRMVTLDAVWEIHDGCVNNVSQDRKIIGLKRKRAKKAREWYVGRRRRQRRQRRPWKRYEFMEWPWTSTLRPTDQVCLKDERNTWNNFCTENVKNNIQFFLHICFIFQEYWNFFSPCWVKLLRRDRFF